LLKEIISLNKFSILNNEQIKNIFEIVKLEINEFKNINAEKENETSSESGQIKKKKGKLGKKRNSEEEEEEEDDDETDKSFKKRKIEGHLKNKNISIDIVTNEKEDGEASA